MFLDDYFTTDYFFTNKGALVRSIDESTFQIDVPGFNKNNLTIIIEGQYVHLKGTNGVMKVDRTYKVSDSLSLTNATASLVDGVLTIKAEGGNKRELKIE